MSNWAAVFQRNFVRELTAAGYSADQIARFTWAPYQLSDLAIRGTQRDTDLHKIAVSAADIRTLQQRHGLQAAIKTAVDGSFLRRHKIALVLMPGFTHETLRNLSWHEQMNRKDSPHQVLMLQPNPDGGATLEQVHSKGDGLKVAYVRYPRSNAAAEHILPPLFHMLHHSAALKQWVSDGYKLFFVGYSYGAPLSLELLAAINRGQFADDFILKNTVGMLSLCGDVGGSYLADDVIRPDAQLVSIAKVIDHSRKRPLLGKLVGLGTAQLQDDMLDGVASLGHAQRQARMQDYAPHLPAHLRYFSVSAMMPLPDYQRYLWQLNLDDYSLYLQAKVSDPISVYNDGQVVLDDTLTPNAPQLAPEQVIHLGAVRTHHWGVSYKTFNLGHNRFPRPAFYRALLHTIFSALSALSASASV